MTRFMIVTVVLLLVSNTAFGQDRLKTEAEIDSLVRELIKKEKEFLTPSPEDRAAFADFLEQPNVGLIRLLPREKYSRKIVSQAHSGGSYYSFVRLTHRYGYGSDISLQQDHFEVGFAGNDHGLFASLGDMPIEGVQLDSPSVSYLATATDLNEQYRRGNTVEIAGFGYSRRIPAKANTTYVLRSISPRRSDVLVAFRAVREDHDGSMTLLWKLLRRNPVEVDEELAATLGDQTGNTGEVRLFSRDKHRDRPKAYDGGSHFSFVRLTHEAGYGSDIRLSDGKLNVGQDLGFITTLGNVPLDAVDIEHPGISFPLSFVPPSTHAEAGQLRDRLTAGLEHGGFRYARQAPLGIGTTYVVRSITYATSDVLIALRAIRQESDGGVVLRWKILKRFPTPES